VGFWEAEFKKCFYAFLGFYHRNRFISGVNPETPIKAPMLGLFGFTSAIRPFIKKEESKPLG